MVPEDAWGELHGETYREVLRGKPQARRQREGDPAAGFHSSDTILITGQSVKIVDGKSVVIRYAYMARKATRWDQQLVTWAEKKAAWLADRKASADGRTRKDDKGPPSPGKSAGASV